MEPILFGIPLPAPDVPDALRVGQPRFAALELELLVPPCRYVDTNANGAHDAMTGVEQWLEPNLVIDPAKDVVGKRCAFAGQRGQVVRDRRVFRVVGAQELLHRLAHQIAVGNAAQRRLASDHVGKAQVAIGRPDGTWNLTEQAAQRTFALARVFGFRGVPTVPLVLYGAHLGGSGSDELRSQWDRTGRARRAGVADRQAAPGNRSNPRRQLPKSARALGTSSGHLRLSSPTMSRNS